VTLGELGQHLTQGVVADSAPAKAAALNRMRDSGVDRLGQLGILHGPYDDFGGIEEAIPKCFADGRDQRLFFRRHTITTSAQCG
jgi:hypothetical protein